MRKITFAIGLGAGYLLGTKAGRARYEQIMRSLRGVKDSPAMQETAGVVQAQAVDLLSAAKAKVTSTVSSKIPTGRSTESGAEAGSGVGFPDYSAGSNGVVR